MASGSDFQSGAVLSVVEKREGQYEISQLEIANHLPKPVNGVNGRKEINWSFGPFTVVGYVITDTYEIGVEVKVVGISIGHLYGNLKDGVSASFNLLAAKGSIKFYLKNGKEVWVHVDAKVVFDGSFDKDVHLFDI